MSNSTPYHDRARHPRRRPSAPADQARPQYMSRAAWERMSPDQRAAVRARALAETVRTAEGPERRLGDELLSAADLAILRPLGRLAVVHDRAERLGLPTPTRPRPTTPTTAEEARR